MRARAIGAAVLAITPGTGPAAAEWQVWGYFGQTFTHDAYVHYLSAGGSEDTIDTSWDGKGFTMPIYYGIRVTRWFDSHPAWGIQADFNHIKTYADLDGTEAGATFDTLEFTDGLNIATLDAVHRWRNLWGGFTPYAGAGFGVNVPHVEVSLVGDPAEISEYQLAGYALVAFAGLEFALTDNLSAFGEYKLSFAHVDPDVSAVADGLKVDFLNHHLNFGLSYRFDH